MEALPENSSASVSKGIYIVFEDGDNRIAACGSCWSGFDHVFFNNRLVALPQKGEGTYGFSQNGHYYRIQYDTSGLPSVHFQCRLYKDGQIIGEIKSTRLKILNIRPSLVHLVAGLSFGLLTGLVQAPAWFALIFISSALALTLLSCVKTDRFAIKQIA